MKKIEELIKIQTVYLYNLIEGIEKIGAVLDESKTYQYERAKLHGLIEAYKAVGGNKNYNMFI